VGLCASLRNSKMKKDFDHIAKNYDTDFTHSEIGKLQRKSVYKYLEKLPSKLNILELNCGTGEDALWFSQRGNTVLATDISEEMIKVARAKTKEIDTIKIKQLDIKNLHVILSNSETFREKPQFDLIFSNFGGLNCLNKQELQDFFVSVSKILSKNGKIILVIMPKNTLWESLYFLFKGHFKNVFRRNTNEVINVNVEGKDVKTWYFNPREIKKSGYNSFKLVKTRPIGFFIPPSYLEKYFKKHKRFLSILDMLEKQIGKLGFLSRFSDHYLIELKVNRKGH